MAISHVIPPRPSHPTSSGAIRALALSCDRHKGAERSQARHLAVDPGVWRDAPGDGGIPGLVMTNKKLLKMAIEIVDFPMKNSGFP